MQNFKARMLGSVAAALVSRTREYATMAALTADRDTSRREAAEFLNLPLEANTKIYAGSLVCMNTSGRAVPGSASTTLKAVGRATHQIDNTGGAAAALSMNVRRGIFRWNNSAAADAIALANLGEVVYVVDDNTVALTDGGAARSRAGVVVDVDAAGVWVDMRDGAWQASTLLNSKKYFTLNVADLVGADAAIYGFRSPVAGTITSIGWTLEQHALATADATITGKIGAAAITTGVITIVNAASAVGNKGSVTPTAANAVAVGDRVNFTVGGGNTNAAAQATLTVEITPSL